MLTQVVGAVSTIRVLISNFTPTTSTCTDAAHISCLQVRVCFVVIHVLPVPLPLAAPLPPLLISLQQSGAGSQQHQQGAPVAAEAPGGPGAYGGQPLAATDYSSGVSAAAGSGHQGPQQPQLQPPSSAPSAPYSHGGYQQGPPFYQQQPPQQQPAQQQPFPQAQYQAPQHQQQQPSHQAQYQGPPQATYSQPPQYGAAPASHAPTTTPSAYPSYASQFQVGDLQCCVFSAFSQNYVILFVCVFVCVLGVGVGWVGGRIHYTVLTFCRCVHCFVLCCSSIDYVGSVRSVAWTPAFCL